MVFLKNKLSKKTFRRGYIALLSVIVVSAIGVGIMLAVIVSGVDASKTDFSLQRSGNARALATSCAEEALQRILETGQTSGSGNLSIASGTCSYTFSQLSAQSIQINATGNFGTVTSKIRAITASTSPTITLSSWEEVSDF